MTSVQADKDRDRVIQSAEETHVPRLEDRGSVSGGLPNCDSRRRRRRKSCREMQRLTEPGGFVDIG